MSNETVKLENETKSPTDDIDYLDVARDAFQHSADSTIAEAQDHWLDIAKTAIAIAHVEESGLGTGGEGQRCSWQTCL